MENNTTNETATNETLGNVTADEVSESGMLDGLMDALQDSPELMLMVVVMAAMAAYIAYTVPAVRVMVMPLVKKYDEQILELLDKNLTAAQVKAYEKLDEAAQKHVKDSLVRNVLITAWDEKDDELASLVKSKVRSALDEGKAL